MILKLLVSTLQDHCLLACANLSDVCDHKQCPQCADSLHGMYSVSPESPVHSIRSPLATPPPLPLEDWEDSSGEDLHYNQSTCLDVVMSCYPMYI